MRQLGCGVRRARGHKQGAQRLGARGGSVALKASALVQQNAPAVFLFKAPSGTRRAEGALKLAGVPGRDLRTLIVGGRRRRQRQRRHFARWASSLNYGQRKRSVN